MLLAYQIAQVYAWRGETEKAFEWLQIAFDNHDTGMLSLLIDPLLRGLHHDARLQQPARENRFAGEAMNTGESSFFAELRRRNVCEAQSPKRLCSFVLFAKMTQTGRRFHRLGLSYGYYVLIGDLESASPGWSD